MAKLSKIAARKDLGFFGVGLYDPKNSFNVGGSLRAVGAFKGGLFVVQGHRWEFKGNPWRHMDTEGAHLRLPTYLSVENLGSYTPYGAEIVGVELGEGAISLVDFVHPKVAYYVFGPEDGALPAEYCKTKVYIPTEYSLNLYTAVTTVCYDRTAKFLAMQDAALPDTVYGCPNCGSIHLNNSINQRGWMHCNACGTEFESPQ